MKPALAGRRLLVTGGAKGIGAATVARFLAEGAAVAALDRDAKSLAVLAEQLADPRLHAFAADITDETATRAAIDRAAKALGGIDGLVNAAGIDLVADIEAMEPARWQAIVAVNLTGPMLVTQAAYPHLKAAGGGTVVYVSSGAGLSPLRHRTAYCASKAGLQMFGKALALEAAAFGIRVNTVCPGAVETALFRESIDSAADPRAAYETVRARYALQRIAQPEEIAAAILWLTSAESSYVTGTALAVDGGRTFH